MSRPAQATCVPSGLIATRLSGCASREKTRRGVSEVASVYFEAGRRLGLAWLRDGASRMPASNHWQKQAVGAIVDDLSTLQAVWSFSDVANGLMAVPNLISLLALNGVIVAETHEYLWSGNLDQQG